LKLAANIAACSLKLTAIIITKTICSHMRPLEAEVEALRRIDNRDSGHWKLPNPGMAFPPSWLICLSQCDDLAAAPRRLRQTLLRLVFDSRSTSAARRARTKLALGYIEVCTKPARWSTTALSSFSRLNAQPEKNKSGLKVYRITYQTAFTESV
jgi:hypothetical protein